MPGRVVVITGASAGVGRAVACEFAKERARIGLIARDAGRLEAAKREVEDLGAEALVLPLDLADAAAVDAAATRVEETFGPIDVWINNAMVSVFSPVRELEPDEIKRVTEVTYLGVVYGTMAALKRGLPRDRGVICGTPSAASMHHVSRRSSSSRIGSISTTSAWWGWSSTTTRSAAYDRRAGERTLTFEPADAGRMRDRETGSSWSVETGEALEGPLQGQRLRRISAKTVYWAIWVKFHPRSEIVKP